MAQGLESPAGFIRRTGFTPEEWEALHPRDPNGPIYHSSRHSLNVGRMMEHLAAAYFPGLEIYMGSVGCLHDLDPTRAPGTAPRVPATLYWMAGHKADLQRRLRWSDSLFEMAKVIIMRTEYPISEQPRPHSFMEAYLDLSPAQIYKSMLKRLPPPQRALALRAGAILSEYADKASWYLEEPRTALAAVEGLVREIRKTGGRADLVSLETHRFLGEIGRKAGFAMDDQLARALNLKGISLPLLPEILARLSISQIANFEENLDLFRRLDAGEKFVSRKGGSPWDY